jgi:alkylation response protein AidB-like acyl-CoA dehydrogenase
MDGARIPEENVVGGVGNGWAVAITTLMNERAGLAFGAQAAVQIALRKLIEFAGSGAANGRSFAQDPAVRDKLAQLLIETEIFRVTNYRGLTKIMKSGNPGPEGSLGKWQWAEINQALMELAISMQGPYGQLDGDADQALAGGEWQYGFLRSRANSIEGGTTEILKNIVAERVLGLPKLR